MRGIQKDLVGQVGKFPDFGTPGFTTADRASAAEALNFEEVNKRTQQLIKVLEIWEQQEAERQTEMLEAEKKFAQKRIENHKKMGQRLLDVLELQEQQRIDRLIEYEEYETRVKEQEIAARQSLTEGSFRIRETQLDRPGLNPFARASLAQELALDQERARYQQQRDQINSDFYLQPELRDQLLGQAHL